MATGKRNMLIVTLVTLVAAASIGLAAPPGFGGRGSRGWAADGNYGRLFDPKAVVTIRGTIASLAEVTPMRGMGMGVHVMLKTDAELVDVPEVDVQPDVSRSQTEVLRGDECAGPVG